MFGVNAGHHFPYRHAFVVWQYTVDAVLMNEVHRALAAALSKSGMADNHEAYFVEGETEATVRVKHGELRDWTRQKGLFFGFSDGKCYIGEKVMHREYWDRWDDAWAETHAELVLKRG